MKVIITKVSVFIATSFDGFIAREDGNLDWLDEVNKDAPKGEDCGYKDFISTIDTLIMGRNTFEKVLSFGFWPYDGTKVIVLTSKEIQISEELKDKVEVSSEKPQDLIHRLEKQGQKKLYIDGGMVIQSFLRENLIDVIIVTKMPILIGQGISLFGKLKEDVKLKLIECKPYDFGPVQMRYKVEKK